MHAVLLSLYLYLIKLTFLVNNKDNLILFVTLIVLMLAIIGYRFLMGCGCIFAYNNIVKYQAVVAIIAG